MRAFQRLLLMPFQLYIGKGLKTKRPDRLLKISTAKNHLNIDEWTQICLVKSESNTKGKEKKKTCCVFAELPAQSRAGLFLSVTPGWKPWALHVPSSRASLPLEQTMPRLVSAEPPLEPGSEKRGARREQPSDPWCSGPTALWLRRCSPGYRNHRGV